MPVTDDFWILSIILQDHSLKWDYKEESHYKETGLNGVGQCYGRSYHENSKSIPKH